MVEWFPLPSGCYEAFGVFEVVQLRTPFFWDVALHHWVFSVQCSKDHDHVLASAWFWNVGQWTPNDGTQYPRRNKFACEHCFYNCTLSPFMYKTEEKHEKSQSRYIGWYYWCNLLSVMLKICAYLIKYFILISFLHMMVLFYIIVAKVGKLYWDRKIILTLNHDCVCRLIIGTTVEDAWISSRWVANYCC